MFGPKKCGCTHARAEHAYWNTSDPYTKAVLGGYAFYEYVEQNGSRYAVKECLASGCTCDLYAPER